ncbi:hypothetical protein GOP47_0006377 [Adiantum capillus-veneris]|uniref:Uncharacterized protein n=1 Tax=Adiantum capillus-veneris TaxID=13818 RepID=A0A9D4V2S0_ADICA|nr:hypothetical protein GOP47_0006377 [Adiantum capillus-veneris]
MQGAALLTSPAATAAALTPCAAFLRYTSTNVRCTSPLPLFSSRSLQQKRRPLLRAQQQDQDYVTYDAKKSVFPAEACEELGGEACEVDGVGPEVKGSASAPKQQSSSKAGSGPDRDVFPGEACDDLGAPYQQFLSQADYADSHTRLRSVYAWKLSGQISSLNYEWKTCHQGPLLL